MGAIDGRFSSRTVSALARYLHDREARVAFTRDHNKKYNFVKGAGNGSTGTFLHNVVQLKLNFVLIRFYILLIF